MRPLGWAAEAAPESRRRARRLLPPAARAGRQSPSARECKAGCAINRKHARTRVEARAPEAWEAKDFHCTGRPPPRKTHCCLLPQEQEGEARQRGNARQDAQSRAHTRAEARAPEAWEDKELHSLPRRGVRSMNLSHPAHRGTHGRGRCGARGAARHSKALGRVRPRGKADGRQAGRLARRRRTRTHCERSCAVKLWRTRPSSRLADFLPRVRA